MIRHRKKLNKFILKEDKYIKRKIFSFTDILSRSDVREILFVIYHISSNIYILSTLF